MSMVNCDGTKWEMVDQKGINTNSDGTVNMTFDKFCPVAFIKDSAAVAVNPNGPASPQTSDINMTVVAAVAAMILVGACAAFVMTGKNRKAGFKLRMNKLKRRLGRKKYHQLKRLSGVCPCCFC